MITPSDNTLDSPFLTTLTAPVFPFQIINTLAAEFRGHLGAGTEYREAELTLKAALRMLPSPLVPPEVYHPQTPISSHLVDHIRSIALRRRAGEPLSRILGLRGFWQDEFVISEATLDPRPETEGLVALSLALFRSSPMNPCEAPRRLLDLGTGTGCVILSLLREFSQAQGMGVDICPRALETARLNGQRLGLNHRCCWRLSDWGYRVVGCFDLIVANPPYIDSEKLASLPAEVKNYDPLIALDGGPEGLQPYATLAAYGASHVTPKGYVIFEIGCHQGPKVRELLAYFMPHTRIVADLAGKDRYVLGSHTQPIPEGLAPA